MISKAKIKFIHSLETKKGRRQEGCFVAEGPKVVGDMLTAFTPRMLVATEEWQLQNTVIAQRYASILETVTAEELRKVSFLQHPQQVLAVLEMPKDATSAKDNATLPPCHGLTLALDSVQDPGNLGTIIRIADWFGIENIVCSNETADAFNPKVVQATMGSLSRVNIYYTMLPKWLRSLKEGTAIYGTFLDGNDIHETSAPQGDAVIVMGNEGNGISHDVAECVNSRILIPNYPKGRPTADSLNVAIATAITCYHMRSTEE